MHIYKKGRFSTYDIYLLRLKNNRNDEEWNKIAKELNRPLESVRLAFLKSAGHTGDMPLESHCRNCGFISAQKWVIQSTKNTKHCIRCKSEDIYDVNDSKVFRLDSLNDLEKQESFISVKEAGFIRKT